MFYIFIHRRKPEILTAIPRLLARLHSNSPDYQKMDDMLYQKSAGYAGEIRVDKYLESIEFPEPVKILTDVELSINPKSSIQIDTLILTPSYAFILEIKNIAGTLIYIPNPPHFVRIHENKKTIVIDCPIMQLENNKTTLDIWFERNNFPMRSTGMIVMANSKTAVQDAPADMPITYGKHLPLYFRIKPPAKPLLTKQQFYVLCDKLQQDQQRYNPFPLCEKNGIDPTQLKKGIICNDCSVNLIRTNRQKWTCPACKKKFKQPYHDGLQDWFMLIKNNISNEECRDYFQMKDKYAANYILNQFPLKREGKAKATIYKWDYKIPPTNKIKRSISKH